MRGRALVGLAAFLVLVAPVSADDPWKAKPYTDWDEKEVRKVITDSPWVKTVTVSAGWRSGRGGAGRGATDAAAGAGTQPANPAGGGGGGGESGEGGANPSGGAPGGGSGGFSEPNIPTAQFTIRWGSSRTLRQAIVRSAQLRGATSNENAEKFLNAEPAMYQIVVLGQDMTPFNKMEEANLKQKTYFKAKGSKEKLAPETVQIQRTPDGKRVTAIIFEFAKKTAAGTPTIPAGEKSVEFTCQGDGAYLKTSFDLRKMVSKDGQDI